MAKNKIKRDQADVATKLIGISVALPLHKEFKLAAEKQNMNCSSLLRKLIIRHLDEMASA